MSRWTFARAATVIALVGTALMSPAGLTALAAAPSAEASLVNRGVVELETGGSNETGIRIVADIVSIVDDGSTRRVVPVIGKGPIQNLTDLKFLRGIDLAIVQSDALDYAREQRLVPGIEALNYVAKLYNEEFHLLAGPNIKTIADLANQTINVDLRGSGTAVTTSRLFELLKITITVTTDNQEVALQRLRKGEIAALALLAAKPTPLFRDLKDKRRAPFVEHSAHPGSECRLRARTAHSRRLSEARRCGSAERHHRGSESPHGCRSSNAARALPQRHNFVEAFFTGVQSLLEPGHHPKWQEVNIAANVPGWVRYPPAEQWLQRNMQVATAPNPDAMKALFSRFVDERRQAGGGGPMSTEDKDALFQQFRAWQRGQAR